MKPEKMQTTKSIIYGTLKKYTSKVGGTGDYLRMRGIHGRDLTINNPEILFLNK